MNDNEYCIIDEGINTAEIKKLNNYKGKLYFISEKLMDDMTLYPRIPKNFFTENGYEDSKTKRVCFAPSVDQALMGMSYNNTGKTFYVYNVVNQDKYTIYKPNIVAVPDSEITGELWITKSVKIKTVGKIYVSGDSGEPGISFKYGDNTAELFKWDYEWVEKYEDES